jgi:hypothetical protein
MKSLEYKEDIELDLEALQYVTFKKIDYQLRINLVNIIYVLLQTLF